jgi:hypothetical protein
MSAPTRARPLRIATVRLDVELVLLLAGAGLLSLAGVMIICVVDQMTGAFVLGAAAVILALELLSRVGHEHAEHDEDGAAGPAAGSGAGRRA